MNSYNREKEPVKNLQKAIEDSDIKTIKDEILSMEHKDEIYREKFRKKIPQILMVLWSGMEFDDFINILSLPSFSPNDRADFLSRIIPSLETDLLIKIIDHLGTGVFTDERNLCHILLEHSDERVSKRIKNSIKKTPSIPSGSTVIWQKSLSEKALETSYRQSVIDSLKKYRDRFSPEELILFFKIKTLTGRNYRAEQSNTGDRYRTII